MVNRQFFERSNMETAVDLGLRRLRFSREGQLHVPEKTKEALIIQTVPYGTEMGYDPQSTGKVKKADQRAFKAPGTIDMYFTPYGSVLAIATDHEGKYSEVSIHGALPVSGFGNLRARDLTELLNGAIKLTKNIGIDREVAKMLDGKLIYDNKFIEISDERLLGTFRFDTKKIHGGALGIYSFIRQ